MTQLRKMTGTSSHLVPGIRTPYSLNLLDHPQGPKLLRDLLDWALARIGNSQFALRFGELVDGFCGPYSTAFIAIVESWLANSTTPDHIRLPCVRLNRDSYLLTETS